VLRQGAASPITFRCAPLGSGARLGGNRDEDLALDGDDCAPADAGAWEAPVSVTGLLATAAALTWNDQAPTTGPGIVYDVLGGDLSDLHASGIDATGCVAGDVETPSYSDPRPNPPATDGYYYLIRPENVCGAGSLGPGRESIQGLACP
jgi:hypothetical protein